MHDNCAADTPLEHVAIRTLRLRAALHYYDADGDGYLSRDEILRWFTDLCTSPSHVELIARALTEPPRRASLAGPTSPKQSPKLQRIPSMGADGLIARPVLIETLVQLLGDESESALERRLAEHGLTTHDMVRRFRAHPLQPRSAYRRVVYDGRAETAHQPMARPASTLAPGAQRRTVGMRDGVSTASVPGYAVNEMLELQPELRAVGGWRGPLAIQRSTPGYFLAASIIDAAMEMAKEVYGQTDRPCERWMEGGCLAAMLGETEEGAQSRAICSLAQETQRVLAAQPSLVHVHAPVKIFGDVHGQLRDLLLLWNHYGTPSHKGGDVQVSPPKCHPIAA